MPGDTFLDTIASFEVTPYLREGPAGGKKSSFRSGVQGATVFFYQAREGGPIYVINTQAPFVIEQMQRRAGAAVDGKFGDGTRRAIIARMRQAGEVVQDNEPVGPRLLDFALRDAFFGYPDRAGGPGRIGFPARIDWPNPAVAERAPGNLSYIAATNIATSQPTAFAVIQQEAQSAPRPAPTTNVTNSTTNVTNNTANVTNTGTSSTTGTTGTTTGAPGTQTMVPGATTPMTASPNIFDDAGRFFGQFFNQSSPQNPAPTPAEYAARQRGGAQSSANGYGSAWGQVATGLDSAIPGLVLLPVPVPSPVEGFEVVAYVQAGVYPGLAAGAGCPQGFVAMPDGRCGRQIEKGTDPLSILPSLVPTTASASVAAEIAAKGFGSIAASVGVNIARPDSYKKGFDALLKKGTP